MSASVTRARLSRSRRSKRQDVVPEGKLNTTDANGALITGARYYYVYRPDNLPLTTPRREAGSSALGNASTRDTVAGMERFRNG